MNSKVIFILFFLLKTILSYNDYYQVENCSADSCPYPSLCESNTICKCKKGYFDLNNNNTERCNYKMYSNKNSFWVEITTNIGIGHFLIGKKFKGFLKLFYMLFTLWFFYYACMSDKHSKKNLVDTYHYILNFINLFLCCGVLIWWLIDAIYFGLNKYKDSNGIDLIDE